MSSLTQLIGAGAGANQGAGVSFEGMPITGAHNDSLRSDTLYIKPDAFSFVLRYNARFFSSIANHGMTGWVTQANAWATIVSTTGTRGKLTNIILPVWRPSTGSVGISMDAEVTIDGKTHTYTIPIVAGIIETSVIGALYPINNILGTWGTPHSAPAPGTDADPGFTNNYWYISGPRTAIAYGAPYLNWTNDMQVRIKINLQTGDLSLATPTDSTAAVVYALE